MIWKLPIIKDIFNGISGIANKLIPDKDKRIEFEAQLNQKLIEFEGAMIKYMKEIIVAEATGNWFQRSWRPIGALSCFAIMINAELIAPYLRSILGDRIPQFAVRPEMWAFFTAFLTTYGIGRSYEKSKKREK